MTIILWIVGVWALLAVGFLVGWCARVEVERSQR